MVVPTSPTIPPRMLIVDNYDSYTFNLFQYCSAENSTDPVVIRNDQFPWHHVRDHILPHFDCVVISPGPGRPDREDDFGVCWQILKEASIPILGVCLGHQGLAAVCGGSVVEAPEPIHGRLSPVHHVTTHKKPGLFSGIPNPFDAVRYHSLVVAREDLPSCLRVTAWTPDADGEDIIMALEHVDRPIWGVQFHPESICTEHGMKIIDNFRGMAAAYLRRTGKSSRFAPSIPPEIAAATVIPPPLIPRCKADQPPFEVIVRKLPTPFAPPADVFDELFSKDEVSFWLDSAKVEAKMSRFSYMGSGMGPASFMVKYCALSRAVTLSKPASGRHVVSSPQTLPPGESFFSWVSRTMQSYAPAGVSQTNPFPLITDDGSLITPPFDFACGLVGYFGYEMKEESMHGESEGGVDRGSHTGSGARHFATPSAGATTPDAAFVFADRVVAFDHAERAVYVLQLRERGAALAPEWMDHVAAAIARIADRTHPAEPHIVMSEPATPSAHPSPLTLAHPRAHYLANIQTSLANINQGETYEVCLTTQLRAPLPPSASPYTLYRHLRARNPAPYGALLQFGGGLALASSSPERFLKVESDGWMVMKPIKGTVARATGWREGGEAAVEDERRWRELERSEKDRAENLM
ncbi:ADC synthase, partial [Blyttiomyces helicus]